MRTARPHTPPFDLRSAVRTARPRVARCALRDILTLLHLTCAPQWRRKRLRTAVVNSLESKWKGGCGSEVAAERLHYIGLSSPATPNCLCMFSTKNFVITSFGNAIKFLQSGLQPFNTSSIRNTSYPLCFICVVSPI